jgi:recombination protein RecR
VRLQQCSHPKAKDWNDSESLVKKVDYPEEVTALIGSLKRLPGIGPRSAERIAVWLLTHQDQYSADLAACVVAADKEVRTCLTCGFFATSSGCGLCDDEGRDQNILCIVEQATDVLPLERSGAFRGLYHSLGGRISPLDNVGPEDLNLKVLRDRIIGGSFEEVILAVGADVEGEATAHYLVDFLAQFPVSVTRLAQGLPAGGGLENADALTLSRALSGRKRMDD